ncbi:MAG TPA: Holliday junction resolvase-like protein [Candidatus Paceibacterota bacterium]
MKTTELLNYYKIQHKIFGICPNTKRIFRLSECHIYTSKKIEHDWLQKINDKQEKLRRLIKKFHEKEGLELNIAGKKQAHKIIKKIDKIFTPNKYDIRDSFGIFDPIDFIIFNGMEKGKVKSVVLFDRYKKEAEREIQDSIKEVVEKRRYKFQTLRINDNGKITEE